MIELDGVRRLLAPRRPMTLVDRVLEVVPGERIVAVKAVTGNEPWYARMPEDTPAGQLAYPPTLLIESWGQAAGILADLSHEGPKGVLLLAGAADVEFHRPVLPGVLLKHRVRLVRIVRELVGFEGEILVDGEAVASIGQLTMAYRPDDVLRQSGPTAPAATTATDRPGEPAA
ncbi:beta-hydroxyacyl-ACP dehydratase [Streptomyces anulatus]|uniref:3-hydroxyacyl-ACP dehydratase FabZ family protein n=1 Tax=Streptomyces TaxID=1883 RepID=UPI0019B8F90C|nr:MULTISPECIES: 3-hydroxyacyl-ACP dehydratase FabZ family protein [Streptomyces]WTC66135.1 beta-hydroxyacyl-ACP dehydratase [Streptomyces anulatus]WUC89504.1 beta-hydroxyacyl-ACP dehydratase [Streptomyces anulatus]GGY22804.1 3-hydroxyacyl-[acyl-carrier-protein] dehydratase FabZ [Streptomyces anulatus]